jgi:membrane protease YdiL (CAAX protease family)
MTRFRIKAAALLYGLLAAAAVIWGVLADRPDIFHDPDALLDPPMPWSVAILLGGAAGVAFGLGMARITRFTVYRFRWARTLHLEFRGLFGPLRDVEVLAFASLSAIAEELFFRGALQPAIGIVGASLIFGALHTAPSRKFVAWPFQALLMGFAFGGLFWLSGNLAAPMLAHFTINYQNLHFINSYDPSLQLPRSFATALEEDGQNRGPAKHR